MGGQVPLDVTGKAPPPVAEVAEGLQADPAAQGSPGQPGASSSSPAPPREGEADEEEADEAPRKRRKDRRPIAKRALPLSGATPPASPSPKASGLRPPAKRASGVASFMAAIGKDTPPADP